jgi:hypothetical protein
MSWSFRGASWLLLCKPVHDILWSAEHRWPPIIMFCHVSENVADIFSGHNVPVPYRSARVALEDSMDLRVSLTFRCRNMLEGSLVAVCAYLRSEILIQHYKSDHRAGRSVGPWWRQSGNLPQMREKTLRWCRNLLLAGTPRTVSESQINMVVVCRCISARQMRPMGRRSIRKLLCCFAIFVASNGESSLDL